MSPSCGVSLQTSKRCPFVIGTGLNATAGNATWKIPNTVPIATYYVQALVYAKNASNPSNPNAVAVGKSVGYFQASILAAPNYLHTLSSSAAFILYCLQYKLDYQVETCPVQRSRPWH